MDRETNREELIVKNYSLTQFYLYSHTLQQLVQKFSSVRRGLFDRFGAATRLTIVVRERDLAATFANEYAIFVALVVHKLFQHTRRAGRQRGVAFHRTESHPSIARSSGDGLMREHIERSGNASVYLVRDEVFEALVERGRHETLGGVLSTGRTRIELRTVFFQSDRAELVGQFRLDIGMGERRRVLKRSRPTADRTEAHLHEHIYRHSRRNGVRIDDEIGYDSVGVERHILLPINHTARAFLGGRRNELVADFRRPQHPQSDLNDPRTVGVSLVRHGIDESLFARFDDYRRVFRFQRSTTRLLIDDGAVDRFTDNSVTGAQPYRRIAFDYTVEI